jgi:glucosamine--fructose-6-phosphate aminotransferase (isomerizing)
MVRDSDLTMMTHAGPEIGVASTKAFTTQLAALALLTISLARRNGLEERQERALVAQLSELPGFISQVLALDSSIEALAEHFADKHHALEGDFLYSCGGLCGGRTQARTVGACG